MAGLKLTKIGWMIKMRFRVLFFISFIIIVGCETKQSPYKDKGLPEVLTEELPANADFYDHIIYDRNSDGTFLSMIVSNRTEIKRMVIENGHFMEIYFNGGKQNGNNYRETIKPYLKSQRTFELTNSQWTQVKDHLLDVSDTLDEQSYNDSLNYYFQGNKGKGNIPHHTLLQLVHGAFVRKQFIYQDDYLGTYFIQKYKKP